MKNKNLLDQLGQKGWDQSGQDRGAGGNCGHRNSGGNGTSRMEVCALRRCWREYYHC